LYKRYKESTMTTQKDLSKYQHSEKDADGKTVMKKVDDEEVEVEDDEKVLHIFRYVKIYHTTGISYVKYCSYSHHYPEPKFKGQYKREIKAELKPVDAIIIYENGNYLEEEEDYMENYHIKHKISDLISENRKKKEDRFFDEYEDTSFDDEHDLKSRGGELTKMKKVYKMYIVDKRFLTFGRYY
jgi:hypothetical protein